MLMKFYVCPNIEECGNYYGVSGERDLETEWTGHRGMNGEIWPEKAHTRAECPDCRARGERVERVPMTVTLLEPPDRVPTPPIPESIRTMLANG